MNPDEGRFRKGDYRGLSVFIRDPISLLRNALGEDRLLRRTLFFIALLFLAVWIFGPTLGLPYLSDDFEHIQFISEIRAGFRPLTDLFRVPFHGQVVILLRSIFWFGTLAGEMRMTWIRTAIVLVHVTGAFACALLCTRWTGSRGAGCLAGILYAGAAGFIQEVISWPSSAIFCLGTTFYLLAIVALSPSRRPELSLAVSLSLLAIASLGLNAQIAAGAGLCVYCRTVMPDKIFWRRRAPMAFVLLVVTIGGLWRYASRSDSMASLAISGRGAFLSGWLVITAPLRFICSWTVLPTPGFRPLVHYAPIACAALVASLWLMTRYERGFFCPSGWFR